jgi:hypothetical protein
LPSATLPVVEPEVRQHLDDPPTRGAFRFLAKPDVSDAALRAAADFLLHGKALPRPARFRAKAFFSFEIGWTRWRYVAGRNAERKSAYAIGAKSPLGSREIIGYSSSPVDRPVVGFKPRFRGDNLSAGAVADGP